MLEQFRPRSVWVRVLLFIALALYQIFSIAVPIWLCIHFGREIKFESFETFLTPLGMALVSMYFSATVLGWIGRKLYKASRKEEKKYA